MRSSFRIYIAIFYTTFGIYLSGCKNEAKVATNRDQPGDVHDEGKGQEKGHGHEMEESGVELTDAQYKVAGIEIGKVEQKELGSVLSVNGVLDVPPQNLVTISAKMGGYVKKSELLQGMRVKKGQLIAVLENEQYIQLQQDYLENKSKLDYLTLEYERQKELNLENVNSKKVLQQAQAEYKTTRARVQGLEQRLAMINIYPKNLENGNISRTANLYAPIDGYVTDVHVNVGSFVNPTDVMFEIIDTRHMHVELMVFEKDISKIREKQKVRYTLPNEGGRERTATVYLIGRKIAADKTVRVHAHMDSEDPKLLPGMYVKASIETGITKVNSLPEGAIVQSEGKTFIFIYKGKRMEENITMHDFEMEEVKTGVSDNRFVEITFPEVFESNGNIVTNGAFTLLGQKKNSEGGEEGHAH
ncbi:MAG TPA: efflux RND transporter periplasmic adaptor subunit [Cytophagaceae bacterium]|jgi:cobalt-zinc-cadmium efflux system membrane fusion protein